MKMICLLLLVLSTGVFAADQFVLSELISKNIQEELKEDPTGNYNISLMATYSYPLAPNGQSSTVPVFLSALAKYEIPKDLQDCASNSNSLVCAAAGEFVHWYQSNGVYPQGSLNLRFLMFQYCESYFCPFYKEVQISVPINN